MWGYRREFNIYKHISEKLYRRLGIFYKMCRLNFQLRIKTVIMDIFYPLSLEIKDRSFDIHIFGQILGPVIFAYTNNVKRFFYITSTMEGSYFLFVRLRHKNKYSSLLSGYQKYNKAKCQLIF